MQLGVLGATVATVELVSRRSGVLGCLVVVLNLLGGWCSSCVRMRGVLWLLSCP